MPFDWNDFLTLAEELANRPSADAAAMRTAISRAYYSVFNTAFARAASTGGPYSNNQGRHQWCWSKFQSNRDVFCRQLGINGDRMKQRRVRVDYQNADIQRLEEQMRRQIREARQLRQDLATLDPRLPLP